MVNVENGFYLWSETFNRELLDIFLIQEEIAKAVVYALKLKLGVTESPTFINPPTHNLRAYELFLQGRLKYQNEQPGMSYGGLEDLEQAIHLAPDFPEAQGLYAYICSLNSIIEPYHLNEHNIRTSYEAALSRNPFQEEALMAKAISVRWKSWDWLAVK